CAELLLRDPFVESGSWIDHAEECEVVGVVTASALGLPLPDLWPKTDASNLVGPRPSPHEHWRVKPEGGEPIDLYVLVDARIPDFPQPGVHLPTQVEGKHSFPGVPNSLPFARVTWKDAGNGWKVIVRREAAEPQIGRLDLKIDRIELDVELPA